jgi:hypothetical protein
MMNVWQAARILFQQRNSSEGLLSQRTIDLHGLHVAEAVECLLSLLPLLAGHFSDTRVSGRVTIVTGSGHHSVGGRKAGTGTVPTGRVFCAVEALLTEWGLVYSPVKDPNGYVGGLSVDISPLA